MSRLVNSTGGLLIVGNDGGTNVGGSLLRGAKHLGVRAELIPMRAAMDAPALVRRFNWWVRGRRPTRLSGLSALVVRRVREERPRWLLATGIAPLTLEALEEVRRLGVTTINFLTDDPWNPAHRAPWFLRALPAYDCVFSPRRATREDLLRLGCRVVEYLPFGFDPALFFPDQFESEEERLRFRSEVVFAGGADEDRVPYFKALASEGVDVSLYGDYWRRWRELKPFDRGYADPAVLRKAIGGGKVALCLVRRANRDGHSMRTFEVPAVGACLLAEDTPEHREIFGEESRAAVYFHGVGQMVEKLKWILRHESERRRMADEAHNIILAGRNTYADRLATMLSRGPAAV